MPHFTVHRREQPWREKQKGARITSQKSGWAKLSYFLATFWLCCSQWCRAYCKDKKEEWTLNIKKFWRRWHHIWRSTMNHVIKHDAVRFASVGCLALNHDTPQLLFYIFQGHEINTAMQKLQYLMCIWRSFDEQNNFKIHFFNNYRNFILTLIPCSYSYSCD